MTLAAATPAPAPAPSRRPFLRALGLNFLWMNASEVFRYFVFVMPMMREAFPERPGVAPMDPGVFAVWGLWDALLICVATGSCWLLLERFGPSLRNALLAGTAVWAAVFALLWLALWNMNLAAPAVIAAALPLAWVELAVAALIVRWSMRKG